jgi:hypothetical protein
MKKPELVVAVSPSGHPLLKGGCSVCHDVSFIFVGDTAENRAAMRLDFENHLREKHAETDFPTIPRSVREKLRDLTARISTEEDPEKFTQLIKDFNQLLDGELRKPHAAFDTKRIQSV